MMSLWLREIAGWCLVALALVLIQWALLYISNRQVVEAGVVVFMLLGILRAGIALIRVATAARIVAREDR